MVDKFFITNYDRNEFVSLIREAFREELTEHLKQQERESDYNILLKYRRWNDH
jgi:hypothetical protein